MTRGVDWPRGLQMETGARHVCVCRLGALRERTAAGMFMEGGNVVSMRVVEAMVER